MTSATGYCAAAKRSHSGGGGALPNTWSDNFNRADGGLGSAYTVWSQYAIGNGIDIVSNQAQPNIDFQSAVAIRNDSEVLGNSQYVKLTNVDMSKTFSLTLFQTDTPAQNDGLTAQWNVGEVFFYQNGSFAGNPGVAAPTSGSHDCEFRYDGTNIIYLVDGVEYINSPGLTATSAGGRTHQGFGAVGSLCVFDNAEGGVWPPVSLAFTSLYNSTANASNSSGSHDTTVDCGTVTTGALLTIIVGATVQATSGAPFTTPTKASGTATIGTVTSIALGNDPVHGDKCGIQAWQVPITAGGTLILNIQDAVGTYGFGVNVLQWTGQHATPIAGAISIFTDGAGAFSPTTGTLGATPVTGDYVVVAGNWDTDNGTKGGAAGSGFTIVGTVVGGGSDFVEMVTATRTASTSTTVTWPTQSGPTTYCKSGVAFIVKAA